MFSCIYFVHIYFSTFLLFYYMNFLLFISTILFILVTHFLFPLFCLIMYFVRSARTLLLKPLFLLYSISFSLRLYSQFLSSSFSSFHLFPLPLASAFYLLPLSFNPILHFYFLFSYQFAPSTLPKISPFLLFLSSSSFLLFVILAARFLASRLLVYTTERSRSNSEDVKILKNSSGQGSVGKLNYPEGPNIIPKCCLCFSYPPTHCSGWLEIANRFGARQPEIGHVVEYKRAKGPRRCVQHNECNLPAPRLITPEAVTGQHGEHADTLLPLNRSALHFNESCSCSVTGGHARLRRLENRPFARLKSETIVLFHRGQFFGGAFTLLHGDAGVSI